jgi:hypothetical protein
MTLQMLFDTISAYEFQQLIPDAIFLRCDCCSEVAIEELR